MPKHITLSALRETRAAVARKLALARTSGRSKPDTVLSLNNQLEALDKAIALIAAGT